MTTQSNPFGEDLQEKIIRLEREKRELEAKVEKLSMDPSYEIMTRQAFELEFPSREGEIDSIAFLDMDYLHKLNSEIGHEEANNRIRRALHLRASDVVFCVKYYSGDEVLILFKGDREGFCNRQKEAFIREGMSITIAAVPYSGDLRGDIEKAKAEVFRAKAARGVKER